MEPLNTRAFGQLVAQNRPAAAAAIKGSDSLPHMGGTVQFYPAGKGTLVVAELYGLPDAIQVEGRSQPAGPFYGFHIHQGESCGLPYGKEPFSQAGGHLNPVGAPHPDHMGDLPALLGAGGYAYLAVYTPRFAPKDILGRTVIVHQKPDDFKSQPAGDSGTRLGCGVVEPVA